MLLYMYILIYSSLGAITVIITDGKILKIKYISK